MRLKAIWELLRLEHGLMYALAVLIGVIISAGLQFSFQDMLMGALTALFLQASAFALNDYFDYEVDVANKRTDRPLVRGDLDKNTALIFFAVLGISGFIFAYSISIEAFALAFIITVAGFFYDIKLKEFGFSGNIYIAFSMAAPFIFGSVVATNTIVPSAGLLALLAFLSGMGREIMKGIEDVEGDALRDVKTIARLKGENRAAQLASVLFVSSIILSIFPPLFVDKYFLDLKYVIPVAGTDALLILTSKELLAGKWEKQLIKKYRKRTLFAMALGLAGFFAGIF
ncbi:MAG: UbiA family prenyltransferase [Halobacteriota archaeon]